MLSDETTHGNHGWVYPNESGIVARCGGPALCSVCKADFVSAPEEVKKAYLYRMSLEKGKLVTEADIIGTPNERANQDRKDNVAALEGKRAWRNNVPITANPYQKDNSAFLAWEHGWLAANSAYLFSAPEGL